MAGWGEADASSPSAFPTGRIDLGNGSYMQLSPNAMQLLGNHPKVREALAAHGQALADAANAIADPALAAQAEGPLYISKPPDDDHDVALVEPGDWMGVVDDAINNSLFKAMSSEPGAAPNSGAQPPNIGTGWGEGKAHD